MSMKQHWLGVDFSASQQAVKRTWLAEGESETCPQTGRTGSLTLLSIQPAQSLFSAALGRDDMFAALVTFLAQFGQRTKETQTFVGLDFSFSLPHVLLSPKAESWLLWLKELDILYANEEQFRLRCQQASKGKELKRLCDIEAKTPFSPYNLRHYRQTYFGLAKVLKPLVLAGQATVYPFQQATEGKPLLAEICPASTLKRLGLYKPYKGSDEKFKTNRCFMLQGLQEAFAFKANGELWRQQVINNPDGDALDSLLALLALHANAKALTNDTLALHKTQRLYEGNVLF